jgi:hypothetical protein
MLRQNSMQFLLLFIHKKKQFSMLTFDNILNLNKITGCGKENGEMLLRWTIFHQEIKVLKGLSHEMDLDFFDDMYG